MALLASTKLTTPSKVHYSEYIVIGDKLKRPRHKIDLLILHPNATRARVPHGHVSRFRAILRILHV